MDTLNTLQPQREGMGGGLHGYHEHITAKVCDIRESVCDISWSALPRESQGKRNQGRMSKTYD